jgi:hypothetical protein
VSTTLLTDAFTRADSTTVPGSPTVGPAPTVWAGTWGISSNRLYCPTLASGQGIIVWDLGTTDADFSITVPVAGGVPSLVMGSSSSDYVNLTIPTAASAQPVGSRLTSGTARGTWLAALGIAGSVVPVTMRVVRQGQKFALYVQGSRVAAAAEISLVDMPSASYTFFGVRTTSTTARFDDASATTIDTYPVTFPSTARIYKGRATYALDDAAAA